MMVFRKDEYVNTIVVCAEKLKKHA